MKLFPISALAGAVIFSLPNSLSAQEANSEIADTFSEDAEQIVILGSRRPGRSVVESNVPIDLIGEDTLQACSINNCEGGIQMFEEPLTLTAL